MVCIRGIEHFLGCFRADLECLFTLFCGGYIGFAHSGQRVKTGGSVFYARLKPWAPSMGPSLCAYYIPYM